MILKAIHRQAILFPLFLLTMLWFFFGLQHIGLFSNCSGAIIPLVPEGLKGIIFSPLLHANLDHIVSNSVPLTLLSFLLFQFYPQLAYRIFFLGWLISGFLVWLLPPFTFQNGLQSVSTCTIGASGIVYFLAFFLFASGLFRKEVSLFSISLMVSLFYGGMIWGMFPQEWLHTLKEPSKISWQSHLVGGLIGVAIAWQYRKHGEKRTKYMWEYPNYYNEKDDLMWQKYQIEHPEDFEELPSYQQENEWSYLDEIRKKKN